MRAWPVVSLSDIRLVGEYPYVWMENLWPVHAGLQTFVGQGGWAKLFYIGQGMSAAARSTTAKLRTGQ